MRDEGARVAAPAVRVRDHRRHGAATLPDSKTPWQDYVDDYDRIRDTMARVLDGFEDFNRASASRTASASRSRAGARLPHPVGPRRVLHAPLPADVAPATAA